MADASAPPATRTSWEIHPCPTERAALKLVAAFSPAEFDRIKLGLIPLEMEDKWFMFFEGPWLYLHRSWTGFCVYGVRFEPSPDGVEIVESWVSRNADQYGGTDIKYEERLLRFLIEALLLNKMVAFPIPANKAISEGLYQHGVVGRAFPEVVFPEGVDAPRGSPKQAPKQALWRRIRDCFK